MDATEEDGARTERSTDSLWAAVAGDGRPLLAVVAVALMFAGAFALFLAARGEFLPHDEAFLGMSANELCSLADCRVVDFMLHDRAAFGGALLAIGLLYLWMIAVPLGRGEDWSWWLIVTTGTIGFSTIATYLGYGYLDSWHGWGTVALVPFAVAGAATARRRLVPEGTIRALWRYQATHRLGGTAGTGWTLVVIIAVGLVAVGGVIVTIGIDRIFVAEDVAFIGLTRDQMDAANPRLVPLIAHDRAGFGSTILVGGLLASGAALHDGGSRSLWQAVAAAGLLAFGPAIVVHHVVGYTDPFHLAPAYIGASVLALGLWLSRPGVRRAPR